MSRRRTWIGAASALVLATAPAVALAAGPLDTPSVGPPACFVRTVAPDARVDGAVRTVDPNRSRLEHWTLTSRAMGGASVPVNVLLPADYATGHRAYKVLYLLHGHGGGADDWWQKADTNHTPLEGIVGNLPLILVMPDGGYDGWYSDWYGVDVDGHNGPDGNHAPAWETFHIDELIPFVDSEYRTIRARSGRLIAGLSMGGFGSTSYAARHPDLFVAAGSFSGAVDTRLFDPVEPVVQPLASNLPDRKPPDNCVWGDAVTQHDRWVAHNPADQAVALERVALYASSGDGCAPSAANPDTGAPGACQSKGLLTPGNLGAAFTEWGVRQQNQSFRDNVENDCLVHACAPRTFDFYSPGIHSWPYWLDHLGKFLAWAHTDAHVL